MLMNTNRIDNLLRRQRNRLALDITVAIAASIGFVWMVSLLA